MKFNKAIALCVAILVATTSVTFVAYALNSVYVDNAETVEALTVQINEAYEHQCLAHEFAENARYFGYAEDSDVIAHAQAEYKSAENVIASAQQKIQESNLIDLHYTPSQKVGLSVAAFDKMLEGTALAGQGQAFYDLEQNYNVNGVFALGVANTESTLGKNCYGFNPFGMLSSPGKLIRFSSWTNAVQYFGKLMQKNWYSGKSIEGIAKTYCPPTYSSWANSVRSTMKSMYSKLD